ncbi:LysR family transcriptional regulator [Chryseobacterium sp. P1-3]
MDIEVLRNFLKLSETLNFTKTSDKVFIAQPALSRQIKKA